MARRLSVRLTDAEWAALDAFVVVSMSDEDPEENPITVTDAVRFLLTEALRAHGLEP